MTRTKTQGRPGRHLLAGTILWIAPLATFADEQHRFDFQALAQEALEGFGIDPKAGQPATFLEALHGPGFVHLQLGSVEICYPASALEDTDATKRWLEAVTTLVDLQENWVLWSTPPGEAREQALDDLRALGKCFKASAAGHLKKAEGGEDVLALLGAKEKVLAGNERLGKLTGPGQDVTDPRAVQRIVFAPTRRSFLEVVALAGWLEPDQRELLWSNVTLGLPSVWVEWTQVVPLEQAAWPVDVAQPYAGMPLAERHKDGLRELVADRGAASLLLSFFYRHGQLFFEEALRTDLVIATVGRNDLFLKNWSNEYTSTGGSTQPYSRFVPGGNPAGGTLPQRKFNSQTSFSSSEVPRWRSGAGEDFFAKELREGQKAGAKLAAKDKDHPLRSDKLAHFELDSAESKETTVVSAPFFGTGAIDKELPPHAYLDDYEEFFRAYRAAFVHWLRTRGVSGSSEESATTFAKMLEKHAARVPGTPLHTVIEEVYQVPMSHGDGSIDSLEWRFLAWIAKGGR